MNTLSCTKRIVSEVVIWSVSSMHVLYLYTCIAAIHQRNSCPKEEPDFALEYLNGILVIELFIS